MIEDIKHVKRGKRWFSRRDKNSFESQRNFIYNQLNLLPC